MPTNLYDVEKAQTLAFKKKKKMPMKVIVCQTERGEVTVKGMGAKACGLPLNELKSL